MSRPLALVAHGTQDSRGLAVLSELTAQVAHELHVPTWLGFVDVAEPQAGELIASLDAPVVVPYFATAGYHVTHDVPQAATRAQGAHVTPALGAADEVLSALQARLEEAMLDASDTTREVDHVVLAAAGTSVASARQEAVEIGQQFSSRIGLPVTTGFLSGAGPSAADLVSQVRRSGGRVGLAPLLLAPGFFQRRAEKVGANITGGPLGVHHAMVGLVARRYREGVAQSRVAT